MILFPERDFAFVAEAQSPKQSQHFCLEPDVSKMLSFLPRTSQFQLEKTISNGNYSVTEIMVILRSFGGALRKQVINI